jgi:hypothetical protein
MDRRITNMNATIRSSRFWFAGLLGAAVLTGSPLVAQADDGKWWDPQKRGPVQERRQERRVERRAERRDDDRVVRGRVWRGERPRFQREYVTIRDHHRGPRYRAHRVWVRPVFFHRQHLCVVRPVRYFVGAGFGIGGVRVHARLHDSDRYYYGCNFCDARFGGFRSYRAHVIRCDHRPHGYRFEVSDWDDEWAGEWCGVEDCDEHGGYRGGYHGGAHGGYHDDDDR